MGAGCSCCCAGRVLRVGAAANEAVERTLASAAGAEVGACPACGLLAPGVGGAGGAAVQCTAAAASDKWDGALLLCWLPAARG